MTPSLIIQQKEELRREIRARRNAMSREERATASHLIAHRVLEVVPSDAQVIGVYLAHSNEANLDEAIQKLIDDGKTVVAPRAGVRPRFAHLITLVNLRTNARGLRFPDSDEQVAPWEIDVMILPGVAFDAKGHRLGQGGGWYDRVLERARTKREIAPLFIGVCFECQIVERVPQTSHDECVDIVMTEDRVLDCRGESRGNV